MKRLLSKKLDLLWRFLISRTFKNLLEHFVNITTDRYLGQGQSHTNLSSFRKHNSIKPTVKHTYQVSVLGCGGKQTSHLKSFHSNMLHTPQNTDERRRNRVPRSDRQVCYGLTQNRMTGHPDANGERQRLTSIKPTLVYIFQHFVFFIIVNIFLFFVSIQTPYKLSHRFTSKYLTD